MFQTRLYAVQVRRAVPQALPAMAVRQSSIEHSQKTTRNYQVFTEAQCSAPRSEGPTGLYPEPHKPLYIGWRQSHLNVLVDWQGTSASPGILRVKHLQKHYLAFVNKPTDVNFSYIFISVLYMFRVAMCPSSGESIVSM